MKTATPVTNAVSVNHYAVFDGVAWFRTEIPELDFDSYKVLPKVVNYDGKTFVKMSFNTDNGTVSYKCSDKVAFGVNQ
jgi:hypothetical protein